MQDPADGAGGVHAPEYGRCAVTDRRQLAAVFAGGCLGALVRSGLTEAADVGPGAWPWPTFAVNVAGALVLGWLAVQPRLDPRTRSLWGPGFCGALTTFSTLQVEVLDLAGDGHAALAVLYAAASVAAGLAAVSLARRTA